MTVISRNWTYWGAPMVSDYTISRRIATIERLISENPGVSSLELSYLLSHEGLHITRSSLSRFIRARMPEVVVTDGNSRTPFVTYTLDSGLTSARGRIRETRAPAHA